MFKKVLIANRGEIALRVIRACRELGIADRRRLLRGRPRVAARALRRRRRLHRPARRRATRISTSRASSPPPRSPAPTRSIPGYGFLAENAEFAETCAASNITFIGPTAEQIRVMGDKAAARKAMTAVGVPIIPGTPGPVEDVDEALEFAREIGFPVIIKAAAGGGGKGMRVAKDAGRLRALVPARALARRCRRSATATCTSRSTSRARATSSSRSSATSTAT